MGEKQHRVVFRQINDFGSGGCRSPAGVIYDAPVELVHDVGLGARWVLWDGNRHNHTTELENEGGVNMLEKCDTCPSKDDCPFKDNLSGLLLGILDEDDLDEGYGYPHNPGGIRTMEDLRRVLGPLAHSVPETHFSPSGFVPPMTGHGGIFRDRYRLPRATRDFAMLGMDESESSALEGGLSDLLGLLAEMSGKRDVVAQQEVIICKVTEDGIKVHRRGHTSEEVPISSLHPDVAVGITEAHQLEDQMVAEKLELAKLQLELMKLRQSVREDRDLLNIELWTQFPDYMRQMVQVIRNPQEDGYQMEVDGFASDAVVPESIGRLFFERQQQIKSREEQVQQQTEEINRRRRVQSLKPKQLELLWLKAYRAMDVQYPEMRQRILSFDKQEDGSITLLIRKDIDEQSDQLPEDVSVQLRSRAQQDPDFLKELPAKAREQLGLPPLLSEPESGGC